MSWSKRDSGPRGYHHGNLKEALVRAALELIAQKGPAGFTFAEAARWAGVSPAAPYRHFRDRDELMADVARRGFELFEAALRRAWDEGRPDPSAAFENLGKAYLEFARKEPAYYSAMFEAGIPLDANPELREAGDRAFNVLRTATETLIATMPARKPAAGDDDGAARLGAVARHRLAVRPRRRGEPPPADDARGACWRPACCSICAGWARRHPWRRRNPSAYLASRCAPLTGGLLPSSYVNVIYIHTRGSSCLSLRRSTSSASRPGSRLSSWDSWSGGRWVWRRSPLS